MPYPRIVMCRVSDGAIIGGVENPVPSIISWPRISDDGTLLITAQRGSPGANGVGVIRLR